MGKQKGKITAVLGVSCLLCLASCRAEYGLLLSALSSSSSSSYSHLNAVLYTATFLNYDHSVLEIDKVVGGDSARYLGDTPKRDSTPKYTYVFTGWDKPLTGISGDTIFIAQYTEQENVYAAKFYGDEDKKTLLESHEVPYGEYASYLGEEPSKESGASSFYRFEGFSPAPETTPILASTDFVPSFTRYYYEASKFVYAWQTSSDGKLSGMDAGGYSGSLTTLVYPDAYLDAVSGSIPVVSISAPAASVMTSIAHAVVPAPVTKISDRSFYLATGLLSCELPSSLKTIGVSAFEGASALESVALPKSLQILSERAFASDVSLQSVSFAGTSLTTIGAYGFYHDVALTSLALPSGLTTLGEHALEGCSKLASLRLPKSVTSVGANCFASDAALSIAYYEGNPSDYSYIEIAAGNEALTSSIAFYSESKPSDAARRYWHYVDSKPTLWA